MSSLVNVWPAPLAVVARQKPLTTVELELRSALPYHLQKAAHV